jgi:hypothetical protein
MAFILLLMYETTIEDAWSTEQEKPLSAGPNRTKNQVILGFLFNQVSYILGKGG